MPPSAPYRDRFHDTLERLEADVQAQGALVRAALARATRGLVTGDAALCGAGVAVDDEVDHLSGGHMVLGGGLGSPADAPTEAWTRSSPARWASWPPRSATVVPTDGSTWPS